MVGSIVHKKAVIINNRWQLKQLNVLIDSTAQA